MDLNTVEKPVRYIGNEWNAITHKPGACLRFGMAYPDVYEVGMSYLGLQILYGLLNERDWIWCERVFAPWPDLEKKLREEQIPLKTVESNTPLKDLDILGFSLQHEMLYTNVLAILELGGIPIESQTRGKNDPLVIAGGPCAFNPMPMVDFIDAFAIGEGEDLVLELCETVVHLRQEGANRKTLLEALGRIPGVFVPSCYQTQTNRLGERFPSSPMTPGVSEIVEKRIVSDFENSYYPTSQIVPNTQVIHHRLALEIMRGCPGGCRFCQAGYTDRPVRERSPERLMKDAARGLQETGFGEIGLLSLSTADYTPLPGLCQGLIECYYPQRIAISLPSLRIDRFPARVSEEIGKVRGTGLTFAPEAGTERLRWAINKLIYDTEIYATVREAVTTGQDTVKFYFMIGLPTETDEDLQGIVEMVRKIKSILREEGKKRAMVHVGLSPFVPKPHTAYQWYGQISREEMQRRIHFVASQLKQPGIKVNWHDPLKSLVEGALARADSRIGSVIRRVYEMGGRFDEWGEYFSYSRWEEAFAAEELSLTAYAARIYEESDLLPWDVISVRIHKRYLWREWEKTFRNRESRHCGNELCRVCRVCNGEDIKTIHAIEESFHSSQYNMEHEIAGDINKAVYDVPASEMKTYRFIIRYTKTGRMIYASHHDLMLLFESIIRRAGIPLAFSEGFHPHPKIIFASPLPVGVESMAEYLEITTVDYFDSKALLNHLQNYCPYGIHIAAIRPIPPNTRKITAWVDAFQYSIDATVHPCLEEWINLFQETLNREDIRRELHLIHTSIEPLPPQGFRLIYTCQVEGGKYTKADRIMNCLSTRYDCTIQIDKSVRLGIFSRRRDGVLEPMIVEADTES